MGDRYRTADGWAVEVVELSATPDRNDGERLKVTYCGFFVAARLGGPPRPSRLPKIFVMRVIPAVVSDLTARASRLMQDPCFRWDSQAPPSGEPIWQAKRSWNWSRGCAAAPRAIIGASRPRIRRVPLSDITITLVRTVAELETWFPLADLEPETLTLCRQMAHGLAVFGPGLSAPSGRMLRRDRYLHPSAVVASAEEATPMPTDPETSLALAAAVQRLANWTGAAVPPSPAAVVTIARRLEIAAHAEVERAVRRVREEGQGWAVDRVAARPGRAYRATSTTRPGSRSTTARAWPGRRSLTGPGSCGTARRAARPSPTTGRLAVPPAASRDTRTDASAWSPMSPSGSTDRSREDVLLKVYADCIDGQYSATSSMSKANTTAHDSTCRRPGDARAPGDRGQGHAGLDPGRLR